MKFRIFTIIGLLFLFLISCTKRGEDFSTSACTQGNLNCDLPSMQVEVVGTDNSTQTNVGNNDAAGNIEIKSIRFGEKAIIEFSMRNPKLSPLRDFTFAMSPGDTSFTVINSTRDTDCSNLMFPLLYNQKCVVTIEYKPTRTPPPLQNLSFKFKTLLGAEFTFTAQFDPATLLPDFYIDDSYLSFPETLIYNTGAVTGTEIEIPIENPGTDTDLTLVQFLLNGSSEWKLGTASTNPCTQGQTLTKRGGICNIKVIFTPLSAGNKSTSLVLISGGNARSYILTSLAKSVSPSLDTLDFGPALLNSPSSTQTLTLSFPTSSGNPASSSCTYSLTGDSAFAISSNSCGATQSAGSSCAISFQWTPSFQVTDHVGHFSWTCDTRGGNSNVLLTAKSVNSPLVTDKTIIDFGKVLIGTAPQQTIKFKNLGSLGLLSNFSRSLVGTAFSSPATTCTTSMTSSGECGYVIQFTPNTTSVMTGTLTAATTQTTMDYAVSIQGTGIAVTPSLNTIDFGLVGIGNDRPGTTIVLTNPSAVDTATGCQLNYADALTQNFSLDSDSTCINKLTLLPGESCSIKSRFTPTLPEGSRNANLTYTCTVGGIATVNLTGTSAIETRLVVAPPSHLYINDHLVGTSNDIEFLLLNEHATEVAPLLSITTPDIGFGWSLVAASANDCSGFTQLTPGASCRVRLRSTPSAAAGAEQAGEFTGRLAVSADHGNIDPPDGYYTSNNKMIVADYSSYTFDSISVNSDGISNPISVTNPSGLDSASGCSLAVSAGFEILSTTCSSSGLAPLSLCTTRIRVPAVSSPTTLTGNLDYTCTVGGRARIPLTVKVEPLPNFLWSGSTHFGSLDTSAPAVQRTYTLTNNDSSAIELTSVSLSGGDSSFSVVSKTCNTGSVLAPSASCVVIISFDSSDENVHYATLEAYARRSGSTSPPELSSLSLDGSGSHMTLTISSSSLTFEDKELGSATTENKTFSITNDGTRTANLTYSSLSSPFTNTGTGTCGTSLSAGASCTLILQMSAAGSIGTSNATLTITETSNGVSNNSTVNLTGRTVAVADLAIKDDVTNTIYSSGITTTDITGTVGNARNITDRSPSSKIVTYTIKNNVTNAGDIVLSNAILNYKSGSTGTMAISTNTCDGATLSAESTCVISVTYTPTADHDTSTFELSLSGNSLGNSLSVAVSNIIGSSFKSPNLSLSSSSITMTTTRKGTTSSTELSLTNNGDYNASLDTFSFSGTDSGYFAKANGTTSPNCGASLAAGASCYFKIDFTPTVASAMQTTQTVDYSYVVGSSNLSSSVSVGVTAASYVTLTAAGAEGFANDDSALEPEIATDGNRIYISSTQSLDNTEAYPIVTVCDLAAKGYVDQDTAKCTQNIFKIGTTKNLLAGTFGGARPKIAVTTNHIFLAVNNQDTNYSGDVLNGSSTIIICNKPGVGTRTISFSTDCYVNPIHTSGARSGSGTFPSMVISGNKIAFANAISNAFKKGFIITVCDFDDTQSTPSAVLTLATCVYHTEDLGDTDRSQMGHLAFNNSKLIYAAYNKKAGEESLAAIACAVNASDNAITCGSYSTVTSQTLDASLYPGAYPSVIFDGTSGSGGGSGDGAHFYVAHQQGETTFHYLRLSDCTLNTSSGGNGFSCSTQTIASHTGIAGLGMVPRISLVGTGPGARLWISYIGSSNETVWIDAYSEIRYCTIQNLSPPTCGVSPYFTMPYSISAEIPSRGHIIDTTNNVMIIPQITGSLNRIGTVSVGLTPEL